MEKKIGLMKRSKWDKIVAITSFAGTVILFVWDKLAQLFDNFPDLQVAITVTSVLSLFYFIWSFTWDDKFQSIYKKLASDQEYLISRQNDFNDALSTKVKSSLIKHKNIESRILAEFETDLSSFLHLSPNSSDYAQIYVITNSYEVESEGFGDIICRNIISNHQYIYVTPFDNKKFIDKLHDKLFESIPAGIDKHFLEAAVRKNIRHLPSMSFFDWLPDYSDMVVYAKKQFFRGAANNNDIHGYYAFQNSEIEIENTKCYYYSKMTIDMARRVEKIIQESMHFDLTFSNWVSPKAEIGDSEKGGRGLFCKERICQGDTIFIKGGKFIKKNDLAVNLKKTARYLQVSNDFVLSSVDSNEDQDIGLPINHSCRMPNCGFNEKNPIEIVAKQDIEIGSEILIDYAFFDPSYVQFNCKCCTSSKCTRQGQSQADILKSLAASKEYLSPYLREQ